MPEQEVEDVEAELHQVRPLTCRPAQPHSVAVDDGVEAALLVVEHLNVTPGLKTARDWKLTKNICIMCCEISDLIWSDRQQQSISIHGKSLIKSSQLMNYGLEIEISNWYINCIVWTVIFARNEIITWYLPLHPSFRDFHPNSLIKLPRESKTIILVSARTMSPWNWDFKSLEHLTAPVVTLTLWVTQTLVTSLNSSFSPSFLIIFLDKMSENH